MADKTVEYPSYRHFSVDPNVETPESVDEAMPAQSMNRDDGEKVIALNQAADEAQEAEDKARKEAQEKQAKDAADGNLPTPSEHLAATQGAGVTPDTQDESSKSSTSSTSSKTSTSKS